MPGARPPDREYISFWIDEEVFQKALTISRKNKLSSPQALAKEILEKSVDEVTLTHEDYLLIAKRVKANERKKHRTKKS